MKTEWTVWFCQLLWQFFIRNVLKRQRPCCANLSFYLWHFHHFITFRCFNLTTVWPLKTKSGGQRNEIRRTCPLYYHTATHTHTHMQVATVEDVLCIFPSWHPPPGTARSSGRPAMRRPGTKSKCSVLTWSGSGPTSICSFCMFLLLGFYGGNPGNTGRTCKLHTERPGNKPRHVARCGTWTHDLLAVRQQCYALCHRESSRPPPALFPDLPRSALSGGVNRRRAFTVDLGQIFSIKFITDPFHRS